MSPAIVPMLSFPLLDGIGENGRMPWQAGNKSVREVMVNILLTRPGERLMRPEFGAGIRNFIHQPNNETTRALLADAAQQALKAGVAGERQVQHGRLVRVPQQRHARLPPLQLSDDQGGAHRQRGLPLQWAARR